jgi:hypothetical protein
MAYRSEEERKELCVVCSAPEVQECQSCQAFHCNKHLAETFCVACTTQLWKLERSRTHGMGIALGVGGAVLAATLALGVAPWAGAISLLACLGARSFIRPLVRRSLQNKALPPSSQRQLPAPDPQPGVLKDGPKKRRRSPFYKPRKRANAAKLPGLSFLK